jgi:pyruvate carboxylase
MVKLTVWGENRGASLARMLRALEEIKLIGTSTNLPLLQSILRTPEFQQGNYSTQFQARPTLGPNDYELHQRDLAVIASLIYLRRIQSFSPSVPERVTSGWHRKSRRLEG